MATYGDHADGVSPEFVADGRFAGLIGSESGGGRRRGGCGVARDVLVRRARQLVPLVKLPLIN